MVIALDTLASEEFLRETLNQNQSFNGYSLSRKARGFLKEDPLVDYDQFHSNMIREFHDNYKNYKLEWYAPTRIYRFAKEFFSTMAHPTSLIHRFKIYFGRKTPFIKAKSLEEGLNSFSELNNQQISILDNEDKDRFSYPARIINKMIAYKNLIKHLVLGDGIGGTYYHYYSQKIDKQVKKAHRQFRKKVSEPIKEVRAANQNNSAART
jgi:hypothetical protein